MANKVTYQSFLDSPAANGRGTVDSGKAWVVHPQAGILAFVNARGSCSARQFNLETGRFVKIVRQGCTQNTYQVRFEAEINASLRVTISKQVNLEAAMIEGLPAGTLAEIQAQVKVAASKADASKASKASK